MWQFVAVTAVTTASNIFNYVSLSLDLYELFCTCAIYKGLMDQINLFVSPPVCLLTSFLKIGLVDSRDFLHEGRH